GQPRHRAWARHAHHSRRRRARDAPGRRRWHDRIDPRPPFVAGTVGVVMSGAALLSPYVHSAYCQAKCPYCDFNSYAATSWPENAYADALLTELRLHAAEAPFAGARIATVFFGGGTPSRFRPATIARLLDGIAAVCPLA